MNKQLKCTLQWILGIAAAAAAVVILLITAFEAAMYLDFSYYQKNMKNIMCWKIWIWKWKTLCM